MTNSDIKLITAFNAEELKYFYFSQKEELQKIIETCTYCSSKFMRYLNSDQTKDDKQELNEYFEVSFDFHKRYFETTEKMKFANVLHNKLTGKNI